MVPKMCLSSDTRNYNNDWVEALDVENMLLASELIVRASLMREESRGSFQREDFPYTDNQNWLKNIKIK
jgi:succinate dehydrogenase/fumarate reductase flavoprotein subunit